MPSSRRRSGAVVLLALGLALTGCGSGDKPAAAKDSDPAAWVGAFCGGLGEVVAGAVTLARAQPTAQSQKESLLAFADSSQLALASTARRLEELGPPRIVDGKRMHDTAVGFFTNAAGTVAGQRPKLAALDPNAPDFLQQLSKLPGPDLGAANNQARELTSNRELMPIFRASPPCQQLGTAAAAR